MDLRQARSAIRRWKDVRYVRHQPGGQGLTLCIDAESPTAYSKSGEIVRRALR